MTRPFLYLLLIIVFSCSANKRTDIPYILQSPDKVSANKLYPLIVTFHGAGGRGNDLSGKGNEAFNVLKDITKTYPYEAFLFYPQCPIDKKWVNTDWHKGNYNLNENDSSKELEWVSDKLDYIIRHFPIDTTRIYITGQSMGGYAAWNLLMKNPNRFACAIPICGGADLKVLNKVDNTAIWMFHGENDNTVPVKASRDIYKKIVSVNKNVKYTELKGVGHNAWSISWKNDSLIDWMFQQKN